MSNKPIWKLKEKKILFIDLEFEPYHHILCIIISLYHIVSMCVQFFFFFNLVINRLNYKELIEVRFMDQFPMEELKKKDEKGDAEGETERKN